MLGLGIETKKQRGTKMRNAIKSGTSAISYTLHNGDQLLAIKQAGEWSIWRSNPHVPSFSECIDCLLSDDELADQLAILILDDDKRHTGITGCDESDLILADIE